jgi:PAS domain S-box-containing protein
LRASPGVAKSEGNTTAPSTTQEPLESFLESSPDAFIGFEPSGRIVVVNRPAQELLGYERAGLIGQSIEVVLPTLKPAHGSAQGDTPVFSVPTSGLRHELEARRRDATTIQVELTLTLTEAGTGPLIMGRLGNLSLTSREDRALQEQDVQRAPEQVAHVKDEFLATLAHELRTPLHSMLGWTQLLRSAPRDQDITARALEIIERNIRRQVQVIDDLIDLAEVLSGQLRLEVRPVPVTPIINGALEAISESARSKGVRLVRSLDTEEIEMFADPDRLKQVLSNLLSNALKVTPEGGQVEVRSQVVGAFVQITISDTGQGIDAAVLPRIFDSVRDADESSPRHEFPGLGLSIVRSLVELQGGSVHAASAGLGQGASFVVSLPLSRRG